MQPMRRIPGRIALVQLSLLRTANERNARTSLRSKYLDDTNA
jgi:hypothetical protein